MKQVRVDRKTNETDISLCLDVYGSGKAEISSGNGFFDHMLTLFAAHGRFDLTLACKGDLEVDFHHSAEDIGIALGQAFKEALGDKRGISRYGFFILPMDEALVLCAVDASGRPYLGWDVTIPYEMIGAFPSELAEEFWLAFCRTGGFTIHVRELAGKNSHHIVEAVFKCMGRALAASAAPSGHDDVPSTKGTL
ncbi:MAG: imidazoleglycerol-phosphate dehydratase HisB [Oscillospiraceae bacterium]|nr:imidazoleglycerol-phosphate dehydratase HisB [Oscillospiraceae bacterium]